jgi:hypothetical protein
MIIRKASFLVDLLFPKAVREQEIREVLGPKVDTLYKKINGLWGHIESEKAELSDTIQELQWLLTTGASIPDVKMFRYLPVRLYLTAGHDESGDDEDVETDAESFQLTKIEDAIRRLLGDKFQSAFELPVERGSLIKRFWMRTLDKVTQKDVENRIENALEIRYLSKPQAEATKSLADGASSLINSLVAVPSACIQVGSLLLAKWTAPDGKCHIAVRTLSPHELRQLEEDRSILHDPRRAVAFLESPFVEDPPAAVR